jgi:DNA-directed RNA polymerase specialized sigma24 family protein
MATGQLGTVLRHVRKLVVAQNTRESSDAHLLHRFTARREDEGFAALVQRQGPLVWGVCRHVLRDEHDAEDAFQARFLMLARNAAAIRKAEALAGWLHGATYRIALRARCDAAIRRVHERRGQTLPAKKTHRETLLLFPAACLAQPSSGSFSPATNLAIAFICLAPIRAKVFITSPAS